MTLAFVTKGLQGFQGLLLLICFTMVSPALAAPYAYPVKKSANGRYLVDQKNVPFLVVGDSPHSLIANLGQADAATYLYNRAANGFNTLWVETLCYPYTGGRSNGSLLDGTLPFTRTLAGGYYDLTAPNSNYFAYVDTVLTMAATNHLLVMLDPCETGGWLCNDDEQRIEQLLDLWSVSGEPLQELHEHRLD